MINGKRVLGVIPARGGSKGLPRKNIRNLNGRPLLEWSIHAAQASQFLDDVVVSTEDAEIAEVSRHLECNVIDRPAELARDEVHAYEVVLDVICQMQNYDIAVLLQPTTPLRTAMHIDQGLKILEDHETALSCVSVTMSPVNPAWMKTIGNDNIMTSYQSGLKLAQRQDLLPVYVLNGAFYAASVEVLRKFQSFHTPYTAALIMNSEDSVDIDTELDLIYAECLLKSRLYRE